MALISGPPTIGGLLGNTVLQTVRTNISGTLNRRVLVNVGATGAPTLSPTGTAFGITRNSAGSYAITYPAQASGATCWLKAGIAQSAATTVAGTVVTALAPTSGTATLITYLNTAGTPVDPANGDSFWMELISDDTGNQ